MSFIKEENIGKISFISSLLIVILLITILGGVFIRDKYKQFQKDLKGVEKNYTDIQKDRLKSEVLSQISRMNSRLYYSEQDLNIAIQKRVYEAHAITENLYQKYYGTKKPEEIISIISEALRSVRFNDGRGYYFIRSMDGAYILYPPDPSREGTNVNITPFQDRKDLFQKMIYIARNRGEGAIQYQWPKPGIEGEKLFSKTSYIKYFQPFDWIIGTGEYLDDFNEITKQTIVRSLNNKKVDLRSPEYIFIYQLHDMNGGDGFATMLVNPNRLDLVGKKISDDLKDAKGKMFRREMLRGIKEKGEAFVTYWYKKPGSDGIFAKLSYFKYYPEWNWIVAKGTYLDQLDQRVAKLQLNLREQVQKTIRFLVYFLILTCLIFLCISYLFSKGIYAIFEGYKNAQKEHQKELERVNKILKVQATTDPLTKLYNRGYFNECLKREIHRCQRYGSALTLIIFDIDKFKRINDTFGHVSGDEILKDLSHLCATSIRSSDILARWGGEEFVILVPENDEESSFVLAEKIRKRIEQHTFSIDSKITCSFGITKYIEKEGTDEFTIRADKALYKAKDKGRNQVVSY
ncbi:MAG: hypothetical protein B6230_06675 [Desulfobacteraceae bacterium 4572_89]|nr:MAG: hypothetical protein B6230_06675 [Desulfobacteraceae bacterium 4572_89]